MLNYMCRFAGLLHRDQRRFYSCCTWTLLWICSQKLCTWSETSLPKKWNLLPSCRLHQFSGSYQRLFQDIYTFLQIQCQFLWWRCLRWWVAWFPAKINALILFVAFYGKMVSSHHLTKSDTTSPCSDSSLWSAVLTESHSLSTSETYVLENIQSSPQNLH